MFLVFPFEGRVPLFPRGSWLLFDHVQSQVLPAGDTPDPHLAVLGLEPWPELGGARKGLRLPMKGSPCPLHCSKAWGTGVVSGMRWHGSVLEHSISAVKGCCWPKPAPGQSLSSLGQILVMSVSTNTHPESVTWSLHALPDWVAFGFLPVSEWPPTAADRDLAGQEEEDTSSGCLQPAPAQRTKEEKPNTREWHRFTASRDVASRSKTEGAGSVGEGRAGERHSPPAFSTASRCWKTPRSRDDQKADTPNENRRVIIYRCKIFLFVNADLLNLFPQIPKPITLCILQKILFFLCCFCFFANIRYYYTEQKKL